MTDMSERIADYMSTSAGGYDEAGEAESLLEDAAKHITKLETALVDMLNNADEDTPQDCRTRHFKDALRDGRALKSGEDT